MLSSSPNIMQNIIFGVLQYSEYYNTVLQYSEYNTGHKLIKKAIFAYDCRPF